MFTPGTNLTRPVLAQIAVDGKYEEAFKIYAPDYVYSTDAITKLVSSLEQTVSVEFFYKTSDERMSYFGIKHSKGSNNTLNAQQFVTKSVETFVQNQDFDQFIPALGSFLNNDEAAFLHGKPDQIELGVNEWWFTFGPLLVWKNGDPLLDKSSLEAKLADREDLRVNPRNFVGAEVIFKSPIEHWLSTQVSRPEGDKFILDLDQILAIASSIPQ